MLYLIIFLSGALIFLLGILWEEETITRMILLNVGSISSCLSLGILIGRYVF